MYINEPIKNYLHYLAAKTPTPGGGSAAGLSGALGAALLEMVSNFTIGNKKYAAFENEMQRYALLLQKLREEFMGIVDEDVKVYARIRDAYKTKDEKIIDKALKDGYYISIKLCELSKRGIEIAQGLSEKGNSNLITDVGSGIELLEASFNAGKFNAEINLKYLKNKDFIEKEKMVMFGLEKDMKDMYKKALAKTKERMS